MVVIKNPDKFAGVKLYVNKGNAITTPDGSMFATNLYLRLILSFAMRI